MRLLLVEDDPMIGESVRRGLRQDGFTVDWVQDGAAAEVALRDGVYELLLLDLGLPKKQGLEILSDLRNRGKHIPTLILTARDTVADRVKGLDSGADDYLVKPFDLDELAARIRALLRRNAGRVAPHIEYGDIVLDPASHQAFVKGAEIVLSRREFALLEALLHRAGAVLSRSQLEEKLYGWEDEVQSNTVEVHIHSLRKKLSADLIRNVRGVGYMVAKKQ